MTIWKDSDHHPSLQGLEICVPNISPACRAKAKSCRLGLPGPCPGLGPPAGRPRYTFLLSSFAVSGRLTGWLRGCWERGTATTATIICLGSFAGGLGGLAGRICLAAAADSRWSCWRRMIFGRIIICLNSYSNPICVLPTVTTLPASLGWPPWALWPCLCLGGRQGLLA